MNSTWIITSGLANQHAPKALFTCVVYANRRYFLEKPVFSRAKRFPLLVYDFRSLLGSEEREDPGNEVGRWGRLTTRHLINHLWLAHFDLRRFEFWKVVKLITILRPTWIFFRGLTEIFGRVGDSSGRIRSLVSRLRGHILVSNRKTETSG